MTKIRIVNFLSALFLCTSVTLIAQIKLPSLIGDGMVLQRNAELKIWGWASPGEEITINFKGEKYEAKSNSEGEWSTLLPPMKAGGPYTMEISGSNKIELENILIGDVWLCSGQSNMVHHFGRHQERYAKEIAKSTNAEIRQFRIPTLTDLQGPKEELPEIKWESADPQTLLDFSVVAYFFAKKLHDKYKIPIGFINSSVGGTPIESWTSEEGFKDFPDILETIQQNKDTAYVNEQNRKAWQSRQENNRKPADKGLIGSVKWFDPSYEPLNWKRINIPGYWEDQGVDDLNGTVWYRKEINIPETMTGVPAMIKLGRIVDADEFYVNGEKVGNTTYQYPQRRYEVEPGVLKPGKNLFVIRVTNNRGKGGFVPDKPYYVAAAGDTIDLKGYWLCKVGEARPRPKGNFVRGISAQNSPTALYNAMIAPLTDYAIKGFVWYQGESNSRQPEEYKKLLPALINDWRNKWEAEDLPFLVAQLPNFMDVNYLPSESNWALMREAQLEALKVSNTGVAVTIDLGEWNDIHPGNKKPVGERLALWAMKVAYGEKDMVYSGPIFKTAKADGNKVILSFDQVGSGLVSGNGEPLAHFAIAGKDKEFVWGQAIIEDDKVIVWHEDISEPKYIRYAWADNPDFANLYNKEGLPASPFRTEVPSGDK